MATIAGVGLQGVGFGLASGVAVGKRPSFTQLFSNIEGAYSLRDLNGEGGNVIEGRNAVTTQNFTAVEIVDGTLDAFAGNGNVTVRTWYDQSGNGNDLSQTASDFDQPLIVENGDLITDKGRPTIKFIVHEFLDSDSAISSQAQFVVCNPSDVSSTRSVFGRKSVSSDFLRFTTADDESYKAGGVGTTFSKVSDGKLLIFSVDRDSSNNTKAFEDGTQSGVTRTNIVANCEIERVGARNSVTNPFIGNISELILFSGDQSSNRTAITNNINEHYGIF